MEKRGVGTLVKDLGGKVPHSVVYTANRQGETQKRRKEGRKGKDKREGGRTGEKKGEKRKNEKGKKNGGRNEERKNTIKSLNEEKTQ